MKVTSLAASLALGASLLLASSALAANKGSLQLFEKVTVDGHVLSPGQYKVEWSGTGDKVQVQVLQGNSVVATVPATMQPGNPEDTDGYITTKAKNGTDALSALFFSGKNWTLQLHPSDSASTSGNAHTSGD
jgi:hypothetical protein